MQELAWAQKDLLWNHFLELLDKRSIPGEERRAIEAETCFLECYKPTSNGESSPFTTWQESEQSNTESEEY